MNNSHLAALFFAKTEPPLPNNYFKKTLVTSPIIRGILPDFKVFIHKPLSGLVSTSINDENDQTLHAPTQDSYFGDDMIEDDDILWGLEGQPPKEPSSAKTSTNSTFVTVLVKSASLSINGVSYALNSSVRSFTRIYGGPSAEDSLLISLKSGFLLLIRIYRVSRGGKSTEESTTSHVFRPYCVQWWDSSDSLSLEISGKELHSHTSGMAVVSTSASSVFRIHMCQPTETGIQLSPHFNVPVDGVILHSCFSQPLDKSVGDNHYMFLTLTMSDQRRLELSLYNWYAAETLGNNLAKCTLPLSNAFPLPVKIVPLAKNNSFLFIGVDQLTIVSVHCITSADYSFSKFAYDGSFPTAVFVPEGPILSFEDDTTDEVLLASDTGVIYSIIVENNTSLVIQPIIRVADPISVFTLLRVPTKGFHLHFASDTAGAKELLVSSLFSKEYLSSIVSSQKLGYSGAILKQDYHNWAPILDVQVIESYKPRNLVPSSSQELWALTGVGKRTKLSHLRSGYRAKKETDTFEFLRKCIGLFVLDISETQFLICSMSFGTKVLQYHLSFIDEDEDRIMDENAFLDVLMEIEDPVLDISETTLCISSIPSTDLVVQFTPCSVTFSNLRKMKIARLPFRILFASIVENYAFLINERSGGALEFQIIKLSNYDSFDDETSLLESSSYKSVSYPFKHQISCMKAFTSSSGSFLVFFGTFSGLLIMATVSPESWDSPLFMEALVEIQLSPSKEFTSINLDSKNMPHSRSSPIAHDIVYSEFYNQVFVGGFLGDYIQLQIERSSDKMCFTPVRYLCLGTTPVQLETCKLDPNFLFAHLHNLWMFNFYVSEFPLPVLFEEKSERAVLQLAGLPTREDQFLRFAFIREDGLTIGSIFAHEEAMAKQISIGDSAKKLVFLDNVNLFALLCQSKDMMTRLKFADRKTKRILPVIEIDSRLGQQRKSPIFQQNEIPVCAFVWEIQRHDRVSKKLIVGTRVDNQSGTLKVLDVGKIVADAYAVRLMELISIPRDEPVTCIQQVKSTIFFSSGCKIYSTSYSLEERKLRSTRKLANLSSAVVSMLVNDNDSLLVSTSMDSLIVFEYVEDEWIQTPEPDSMEQDDSTKESLLVSFKDPVSRSVVNHAQLSTDLVIGDKLHSSLIVIDPQHAALTEQFKFKMSFIPRVFIADFCAYWSPRKRKHIVTVGVNGEIVAFTPVNDGDLEVVDMKKRLIEAGVMLQPRVSDPDSSFSEKKDPFYLLREQLNRPFFDKVTGKGLHSVHRLFFEFPENKGKVIDCDLEEISRVHHNTILL